MFTADYRSSPAYGGGYPTTFGDVACAIRSARQGARQLGGDPSRVTLVAHSFGGFPGVGRGPLRHGLRVWGHGCRREGGRPGRRPGRDRRSLHARPDRPGVPHRLLRRRPHGRLERLGCRRRRRPGPTEGSSNGAGAPCDGNRRPHCAIDLPPTSSQQSCGRPTTTSRRASRMARPTTRCWTRSRPSTRSWAPSPRRADAAAAREAPPQRPTDQRYSGVRLFA